LHFKKKWFKVRKKEFLLGFEFQHIFKGYYLKLFKNYLKSIAAWYLLVPSLFLPTELTRPSRYAIYARLGSPVVSTEVLSFILFIDINKHGRMGLPGT